MEWWSGGNDFKLMEIETECRRNGDTVNYGLLCSFLCGLCITLKIPLCIGNCKIIFFGIFQYLNYSSSELLNIR